MVTKSTSVSTLEGWKTPYFDPAIAEITQKQNVVIGSCLITLCKFGFCGISKISQISPDSVCYTLDSNGIRYASNPEGMIWLESIDEGLKNIFLIKTDKKKGI